MLAQLRSCSKLLCKLHHNSLRMLWSCGILCGAIEELRYIAILKTGACPFSRCLKNGVSFQISIHLENLRYHATAYRVGAQYRPRETQTGHGPQCLPNSADSSTTISELRTPDQNPLNRYTLTWQRQTPVCSRLGLETPVCSPSWDSEHPCVALPV